MKDREEPGRRKPGPLCSTSGPRGPRIGRICLPFAVVPLVLVSLFAVMLAPSIQAQVPPPGDAYVTLRTEHFRVTFPEGLEALGRRAAGHAEGAYALLSQGFFPPPGTIDLLVTDSADLSVGFARVYPTRRITIWVQPPVDGLALSHYDEWLELMVTHEVSHVFHLDYTGPLGRIMRSVFGRVPERWPYFSAQTVPFLAVEGIAVHEELNLHGSGRLHGTINEGIVRARSAAGASESIDQGLGSSPTWPGQDRKYVYGGLFFQHLADTHGDAAVVRFLRLMADQWIPYRVDAAAGEAFGSSFGALWTEWMVDVEREVETLRARIEADGERGAPPEILTEGAAYALYPGANPASGSVAYVRNDERSEIQLRLRVGDDDRSLGRWNTLLAPPRWTAGGRIVAPQAEHVDNYQIFRDLYEVGVDGSVSRLTRGLRVVHADPHPTAGFAAVLGEGGSNRLVRLSAAGAVDLVLRESEPGVHWSFPAWSPDGSRLAVVRKRPGGWSALLVLDAAGELLIEVTEERGLVASPSWGPAGESLVWSSDRSGVSNLYGIVLGRAGGGRGLGLRQITDLLTAGTFPSVDPVGGWIYLSVLGSDGWQLARVPYRIADWFDPVPTLARYQSSAEPPDVALPPGSSQALQDATLAPYSALPTLLPRYWRPLKVEGDEVGDVDVLPDLWGFRTSGIDLVGRHSYALEAAMPLSPPYDRAQWSARYSWSGLGSPLVTVEAGQGWEYRGILTVPGENGSPAATLFSLRAERFFGGGVELGRRRLRNTMSLSVGGRSIRQSREALDAEGEESELIQFLAPSGSLFEARLAAGVSTTRSHPFSVSTEEGVAVGVSYRRRWDLSVPAGLEQEIGVDGSLDEVSAVLRAFQAISGPGYARHVLALRVAGGLGDGPGAGDAHFALGGSGRFFPVRGFAAGSLRASRAWSASAEWRFPVALINRGVGAWPIHLDRVAGALFWDAAGGRREGGSGQPSWEVLDSLGAELALTYSLWFEDPERVRTGVAFDPDSRGFSAYVTSGWSF